MDSKKGQGLSLNTVIIAALALIVLVILTLIFSGRIGFFNDSTFSCEGYEAKENACSTYDDYDPIPVKVGEKDGKMLYCCKSASSGDSSDEDEGSN